jgi:hypothetical protein
MVGCFDFGSVSNGGGSSSGGTGSSGSGSSSSSSSSSGGSGSGGGSFCANQPSTTTFCDDFDEPSWMGNWDQVFQQNGSVTVDGLAMPAAPSTPNSLLAQTSAAVAGVYTEADALKEFSQFQGKPIQITATFEMNIQTWDTMSSGLCIAFEVIFKTSDSQFNQIVVNLRSLGTAGVTAQIAENAQGADGGIEPGGASVPFADHPPTQTWAKVEVDLLIANPTGTGGNTVSVKLNDMPEITAQALNLPLQGGPPVFHLGLGYVQAPAMPWAIRYDNFVVSIANAP